MSSNAVNGMCKRYTNDDRESEKWQVDVNTVSFSPDALLASEPKHAVN